MTTTHLKNLEAILTIHKHLNAKKKNVFFNEI